MSTDRQPRAPRLARVLLAALALAPAGVASAQGGPEAARPAAPDPPAEPAAAAAPAARTRQWDEYRIGPEDVLHIAVWQNAELSRTVPVRPDGKISLPLVNDVQAAGLTPNELRDVLKQKLVEYIPSPEISVIVNEVLSFSVSVIGKVKTPGRYKLRSPTTILEVLAEAGGFEEFADESRVVVLRPSGGGSAAQQFKRLPFNYKKVVSPGGEAENLTLQPGDIVVVP